MFQRIIRMIIKSLDIVNYRNLRQANLKLSDGINCFIGSNGAGKTNLLDAIYYLSFCKSFLNSVDSLNITHGEDFFVIQGEYVIGESIEEIYCGFKVGQKKQFKRNKKDYPKLSDHIGLVPMVFISPADEQLIMDGGEVRRRFMDSVISQYHKPYLEKLIRYTRVVLQRNKLLKESHAKDESFHRLLDALDIQLSHLGEYIYNMRLSFVNEMLPIFIKHFIDIAGENESVTIKYQSGLEDANASERLKALRQKDMALGYTSFGVHRDDLELYLNGHLLRREGSQGQKKSFAVALKLAQYDFLSKHRGEKPILVLDDIFDKLDTARSKRLVELVGENYFNQIFISHTNSEQLISSLNTIGKSYLLFNVENGVISTFS